jgi:hypothetical protein
MGRIDPVDEANKFYDTNRTDPAHVADNLRHELNSMSGTDRESFALQLQRRSESDNSKDTRVLFGFAFHPNDPGHDQSIGAYYKTPEGKWGQTLATSHWNVEDQQTEVIRHNLNLPLVPENTAKDVAETIMNFQTEGKGHVYDDKFWALRHGTGAEMVRYLYNEEGNSSNLIQHPLRSGHEEQLYNKILDYTKTHDVRNPDNKITPAMLMEWSLEVNKGVDGKVCIQDAFLTTHNVMRAITRSDVANLQNLKKDDPVYKILHDIKEGGPTQKMAHGPEVHLPGGISQVLKDPHGIYQLKDAGNPADPQVLFQPNNPYNPFKDNTMMQNSNAGSGYHFWVGALAASTMGVGWADTLVAGEGNKVKAGNATGRDELPWGYSGASVYDQLHLQPW